MEDSKKKTVMIGVIAVCLAVAVIITIATRSGSYHAPDRPIWVKCNNPKCNAGYQINLKEYSAFMEENFMAPATVKPPMVCEKCGGKSVYRAMNCEKCDAVFFRGQAGENKVADTCPKCGYSKIKAEEDEARKKLGM